MKKNLTMIAIVLVVAFTSVNLYAEEKLLPTENIYNLSRFDGVRQDMTGLMGLPVSESFFTRDLTEVLDSMFYTTFSVNMAETSAYVLVYQSLFPEDNKGHIIISVRYSDDLTRNYLIQIQNKDEGYVIPCCKDSYAFDLSDELSLLEQEMTDTGKTGNEFLVTLLSPEPCSAEVYKDNLFSETPKIIAPYEDSDTTYCYNIPYIIVGPGLWTGVGLRNNAGVSANVSVAIYDKNGSLMSDPASGLSSIPSKGHCSFMVTELLGEKEWDFEGWMRLSSDQPISGQIFFVGEEGYMVAMPLNPDMSEELSENPTYLIPHVTQTNGWDTFVMVCNPNDWKTEVQVKLFDKTGNMVFSKKYMLPSRCSEKYPVADMVQEFNGSIEITSPYEIVVFTLYSDLKSGGNCYAGASTVR